MSPAKKRYRPDIDGLRALALVFVLIFHAFPSWLPGGFIAVDIFFVISGYLISGIILDARATGTFTFAEFYSRRLRRIFPALALVLASVLVVGWALLFADDYARLGRHVLAGAAFASNFAFWQEASYFDVASNLKPLLHLWSLGVEEQFYVLWPLMLVFASRWRRGPVIATLAIGTVSFLIGIWMVRIDRTGAYYAPQARFWELLAGALLASIEADRALNSWKQRLLSRSWVPEICSTIGAIAIALSVWLIDSSRVFPGLWVLLPVGGTALLIAAGPEMWVNRVILSPPIVVFFGKISYPVYLWHWPFLVFPRILTGEPPSVPLRFALLGVCLILGWAVYEWLERPVRLGWRTRYAMPVLVLTMVIVGASGWAVYSSKGFIERPINRSDAAGVMSYYERLRTEGIADAYRRECDFMDWKTERTRTAIDSSCTTAGRARTVMLWGDSFAQALSLGLRESLPADASLAQVATSFCRAQIGDFDLSVRERRCEVANRFAMDTIGRLRPAIVVIAQSAWYDETNWPALTERVLALGAAQVSVVGPAPIWSPGLPRIYAANHMQDHAEYVGIGLRTALFDVDRRMAARLAGLEKVTYLSLLDQLCRDSSRRSADSATAERACLARVPGEDPLDLMALDFGHLTPKGSSYLGRKLWKPYFERMFR